MARVLCLHGLGGTSATMAPLVAALSAAGHDVIAPTLPGHGTAPEDLVGTTWNAWLATAAAQPVDVAVGQSMGAALALDLAARGACHGVVAINPLAPDPDAVDGLEWRRERGTTWVDVEPSTVGEEAYLRLPIEALLTMASGVLDVDLSAVTCPVQIVTSRHDDVVDPASSDAVAAGLLHAHVDRLSLDRSGHVASLDVEHELVARTIVEFVGRTIARSVG